MEDDSHFFEYSQTNPNTEIVDYAIDEEVDVNQDINEILLDNDYANLNYSYESDKTGKLLKKNSSGDDECERGEGLPVGKEKEARHDEYADEGYHDEGEHDENYTEEEFPEYENSHPRNGNNTLEVRENEETIRDRYLNKYTKPVFDSGKTKITLGTAKLYGLLDKDGNLKLRSSKSSPEKARKMKERMNTLATTKTQTSSSSTNSDDPNEKELTFKPQKDPKALRAMYNKKCGYDFVNRLKTGGDFLQRLQDHTSKDGMTPGEWKLAEEEYNASQDKLICPKCQKTQAFNEVMEKQRSCRQCNQRYVPAHTCDLKSWTKRQEECEEKKARRLAKIREEAYLDLTFQPKVGNYVSSEKKAGEDKERDKDKERERESLLDRFEKDLKKKNDKINHLKQAEDKECTFQPKVVSKIRLPAEKRISLEERTKQYASEAKQQQQVNKAKTSGGGYKATRPSSAKATSTISSSSSHQKADNPTVTYKNKDGNISEKFSKLINNNLD